MNIFASKVGDRKEFELTNNTAGCLGGAGDAGVEQHVVNEGTALFIVGNVHEPGFNVRAKGRIATVEQEFSGPSEVLGVETCGGAFSIDAVGHADAELRGSGGRFQEIGKSTLGVEITKVVNGKDLENRSKAKGLHVGAQGEGIVDDLVGVSKEFFGVFGLGVEAGPRE